MPAVLNRALGHALEARLIPLPAGGGVLGFGMVKPALHVADDAAEDAVAD
jgi:hypothetical protein